MRNVLYGTENGLTDIISSQYNTFMHHMSYTLKFNFPNSFRMIALFVI